MSVGAQPSSGTVDQSITDLAVAFRNLCQKAVNLSTWINGQGTGIATLEALGYSPQDAAQAQAAISYLNTVAAVYFGTAAQPTEFNFNNQLSQYWAGQ